MANYDEDLYENPFFITVHKQFTSLFNKSVAEKAVICIPKYSACAQKNISETDVKDHILFSDGLTENEEEVNSLYKTLSRKVVLIQGGELHTREGFEHEQSVKLLFEETFHSENDNSYRVLCIEHFLNCLPVKQEASPRKQRHPSTYEECLDLLWKHAGGQKTRDSLDKMIHAFGEVYVTLEGESLRSLVDMASAHFAKAMQLLLRDSVVRRSVKHNPAYMDSLKVAVETYMMNAVHAQLFKVLTALVASDDAEINKMTRNLTGLQLQDIGIRKIFSQNIPAAKKEMARLNRFSTPLGRLFCVKRVVTALTQPLKQGGKTDDSTALMATDDFLSILIFLIIKSEIPNWNANLLYMRHFHLAKSSDDDEFGFYLASVEAALEHIKSGYISEDMKSKKLQFQREHWTLLDLKQGQTLSTADAVHSHRSESSQVTDQFFLNVQEGNEEAVKQMLQKPQRTSEEIYLKLCHPLCACDRCEKIVSASRNDFRLVTAFTRDNRGYTALHMAAYYGQGKLIDLLINNGAVVDATDYLGLTPLHLACQRGYQNVMLLLLHFGANVMARDNEGNTPLHHCCVNGHEDCVKALIFYNASIGLLPVNTVNELGDTALHLAAKWGYEVIVKILLENGASATIKNRKSQSPCHMAQNVRVQRLLQNSTDGVEMQPVSSFSQLSVPSSSSSKQKSSRASSTSSEQQQSLSQHSADGEETTSSRVETASLDEVQDRQLKNCKDKLFRAIVAGDIQLVKFYLGIQDVGFDQLTDDEDNTSPTSVGSLRDMCHPLCQCQKCLSIQKAQVKAGQMLNVNVKTTSGYTPLHMAVLHGHDDLVRLFLQHGALVNSQNHKNLTSLHIAACQRKLLTLQLLMERGAKLNVRDINGDSPLLICSASGFIEGVQLLIQKGADVNLTNLHGNTALHEAADHSNLNVVLELLQSGADPTVRNKLAKTAVHMARDLQMEKELQAAVNSWQLQHQKPAVEPTTSRVNSSHRVVGNSHISVRDLFAAFEEDDLKMLQSLTAAIRGFNKEGSLKKAITRDHSHRFLKSLANEYTHVESLNQSSLKEAKQPGKDRKIPADCLVEPREKADNKTDCLVEPREKADDETKAEEEISGEINLAINDQGGNRELCGQVDSEQQNVHERLTCSMQSDAKYSSPSSSASVTSEMKSADIGLSAVTSEMKSADIGLSAVTSEMKSADIGLSAVTSEMKIADIGLSAVTSEMKSADIGLSAVTSEMKIADIGLSASDSIADSSSARISAQCTEYDKQTALSTASGGSVR